MRDWFRPTLTLRVVIGMSGIFLAVWTVLVAYAVRDSSNPEQEKKAVFQIGEYVSQSLNQLRSPDAAVGFVKGIEEVQNKIFNAEEATSPQFQ